MRLSTITPLAPALLLAAAAAAMSGALVNDPRLDQQYGLRVTRTLDAWALTEGSMSVVVAVNDSGVEYTHPDLYLNIWLNPEEIPATAGLVDADGDGLVTFRDLNAPENAGLVTDGNGNGVIDGGDVLRGMEVGGLEDGFDNGGNGFVDDLIGWDFAHGDNDPIDHGGHGTHIAGILGALADNGVGIAGMNHRVQIMIVKRSRDDGSATVTGGVTAAMEGLVYAVDNGARVTNISAGVPMENVPPDALALGVAAFAYAEAHEHLVVSGPGNDGQDIDLAPRFPESLPNANLIVAAATDKHDRLVFYSSFGVESVDLGAPGRWIWTTTLGGNHKHVEGASFAQPHVAGAAALLLSLEPGLTVAQLRHRLLTTVDPLPDLDGVTVTGGRLNVLAALQTGD